MSEMGSLIIPNTGRAWTPTWEIMDFVENLNYIGTTKVSITMAIGGLSYAPNIIRT